MSPDTMWPWLGLLLLGAVHGINPAMGWLFAVALGLQAGKRRAVWRALPPLALGHAAAIGVVVLLAAAIGLILPVQYLKWLVAITLFAVGVYRLKRARHPRFGGMQVGMRDLTIWSFLMASAHGAGLMVLPIVLGATSTAERRTAAEDAAPHAQHVAHDVGSPTMPGHAAHDGAAATTSGHEAHGTATAAAGHDAHGAAASGLTGHEAHGATLLAGLPDEQLAGILATLIHSLGYLLITGIIAVIVYEKLGLRMLRSVWLNLDHVWAASLVITALFTLLI